MYPVISFDLRASEESVTGYDKKLVLHYRLNKAAPSATNNGDYMIYAAYLNEEEIVIKEIGNELVVA